MKFKVDENLPVEVAEVLRRDGHDADTIHDERLGGVKDPEIAAICVRDGRAFLTLDLDLADIRSYPPADYPGLVVLRLARQDKGHVLHVCERVVRTLRSEPLAGRLWIVEETRIRIHGPEE